MKKGRIVLLVLVLLLGAVTVLLVSKPNLLLNFLASDYQETETEEKSPFITFRELSIELTEDFDYFDIKSTSSYHIYVGDGYQVDIERIDHASITPNEGYAFPSLSEFMKYNLSQFAGYEADAVNFVTEGNLLCVDGDSNGDGEADTLIVLFESANAFWDIRFSSSSKDYATVRANGLKWAQTVTFAG
jgi:hypothetical protein